MSTQIAQRQMPEDRELEKKRAELREAENTLAERELELATYQAELHEFEQRYLRIVGSRYAELDEVNAQVAEARARLHPEDKTASNEAAQARSHAQESAEAASEAITIEARAKFKPTDEMKSLYRDLARLMHPDLATGADERTRRHNLMIEINRAYEAGDATRLQEIQREWQRSPASIKNESVGTELVKIIRQIAQVEERILAIWEKIEELETSELAELNRKVEEADEEDRDLLAEMAADLEDEIFNAKANGYDVVVKLLHRLNK